MKELVLWLTEDGFTHIDDGVWYRYVTPDSTYRVTIRREDVLFTYRMYCGSPNQELIKVEESTCISYSTLREWCDCCHLDVFIIDLLLKLNYLCNKFVLDERLSTMASIWR